jgi:hypothetical protein
MSKKRGSKVTIVSEVCTFYFPFALNNKAAELFQTAEKGARQELDHMGCFRSHAPLDQKLGLIMGSLDHLLIMGLPRSWFGF